MNEPANEAGGHVIGLSLSKSSQDAQEMATAPTIAWLTDVMVLRAGLPVPADLADARAVPGVVLLLGKELSGPGATAATAIAAVASVYAGVEIVDGKAPDPHAPLPLTAADNDSAIRFVIGPVGRHPNDLDLMLEACLLEVDGEVVDSGTGVEAHGHPAEALALAANALAEQNITLQPGWLVFTGGLTGAVSVTPKTTVANSFTHLGSITLTGG